MDLSCAERLTMTEVAEAEPPKPLRAPDDRQMMTDPRVLANLLFLEQNSIPSCDYFSHVQDDVQPFMRKVVTTWMLEVCEEQCCEEQVFPLSVNYLDRFLCSRAVPRNQLQLLASAALLVASKVRQTTPLPVHLLCAYTDNSISPDELRTWELLLLQRLQWQTSAVTAFDIVEHVLARTSYGSTRALLRRHAHTLAALCYTETELMRTPPSLIGTACVVSAARGMAGGLGGAAAAAELAAAACSLTSQCPVVLQRTVLFVEHLVARETQPAKSHSPAPPPQTPAPTTPTHVHDVLF